MSLRLLLHLVAAQPLSSPPHHHRRCAARRLSRDEDGRPQPSLWIFHGLSRFIRFRFMTASSSRGLADVPCMSRRLLSSLVVVGPENLTRARLRHRPPYELRAYVNQYICKLFFCAFFCGVTRIFLLLLCLYLYPRLLVS